MEIAQLNESLVDTHSVVSKPSYEDYVNTDKSVREQAINLIK
jgi:hypothetical protein